MSMTIREAARASGLNPDTLRYYEKIGLLPCIARDAGGRRRYGCAELDRLQFIRRAQKMNFSLAEIARLLQLRDADAPDRASARQLAGAKLEQIRHRLEELQLLEAELESLIKSCKNTTVGPCPIVAGLQNEANASSGRKTEP